MAPQSKLRLLRTAAVVLTIGSVGCSRPSAVQVTDNTAAAPPRTASLATCSERQILSARGRLHFDDAPQFKDTMPGHVSVIFRDDYKVRKASDRRSLSAAAAATGAALNALLKREGVQSLSDFSGSEDEEGTRAREQKSEAFWNVDVPNRKSMFVLRFPEKADTSKIAQALRALPFVRTAYPSPVLEPAASLVSRWSFDNLSGPKTSDYRFNGIWAGSEKDQWHWYNRHRMFDAWQLIAGVPLPAIAVIDSGFATFTNAPDRPNYQTGQSFDELGNSNGTDVTDPTWRTFSHGTRMAEVLASPSNNSQSWAGALPGAPIVPIRAAIYQSSGNAGLRSDSYNAQFYLESVAAAIGYAGQRAETVSISIQASGKPIIWDPTLREAIAVLSSSGKSAVICAGNRRYDLDADSPGVDAGAIIVGGSHRDNGEVSVQPPPRTPWRVEVKDAA